ncbi:MAG: type III-A CRISPR-associated RAMP protein Csm3 [Chloroflexota bacterium]
MTDIQLYGRVFIIADIKTLTGLHIGGSNTGLEIGGVDKAVLRNPLTGEPYIPGSSLRGKMRSQLEKIYGLRQNKEIGQAKIHSCDNEREYLSCPVCMIFGIPADEKIEQAKPARLVVRDTLLDAGSKAKFEEMKVKSLSEFKTEVAIDRVTSAAVPRTMERVPAGAVFGPAELVFGVYEKADYERLKTVIQAMQLVEDDYLGGAGSRGSGKVKFTSIKVSARRRDDYSKSVGFGEFASVQELADQFETLKTWLGQNLPAE